jgi:hypothetical protein
MTPHPFRAAVEAQDLDAMVATLSPDVTFWSPITFKPFEGRDAVAVVLGGVLRVFEDFHYLEELEGDNALALVFQAKVEGKDVTGVDLLRFDAGGLIKDFTVMVRPYTAATALRDAMGRQLGVLPAS